MLETNKTYKSWRKVGSVILTLITAAATFVTFINGLDETISRLSKMVGPVFSKILVYGNLVLLPFGIIVVVVAIANHFTRKYREKIGTHNIPCAIISMYHFKIANRNNKLLKSIHRDIYHRFYKLKDDIQMHRIQSVAEADRGIEDLLHDIHAAILKSFRLDLTINIKRLIMDRNNNLCLIPFKHFRNVEERNQNNPRAFNYCYYIEPEEHVKLAKCTRKARQYHKENDGNHKYEVNSVFTYLITQKKRYWMSNDLEIDELAGDFYTTSDNYPEYYNSMAVFSIAPPESNILPEGLLIFDTKKRGRFSEEECVNLFGYIAHLFYELMREYNNYESKKK